MLKTVVKLQTWKDSFLAKLRKDEEGASLVEYTVLIGLISVAVIGLITSVSGTIVGKWTTLNNTFT